MRSVLGDSFMASILVVDDDIELLRALKRDLGARGHAMLSAGSYDEAMATLAENSCEVMLTDLRMPGKTGLDLIRDATRQYPSVRPVLMSAFASAKDSEMALSLGASNVLCKPFIAKELEEAIERAADCSQGFVGNVHGLTLVDMLQMFHYGQRTLTVTVSGNPPSGISFQQGQIVHAHSPGVKDGEPALVKILSQPSGSLQTTSFEGKPISIQRGFQNLLLDTLRAVDEKTGSRASSIVDGVDLPQDVSIVPSSLPHHPDSMFELWSGDGASAAPSTASEEFQPHHEVSGVCAAVLPDVSGAILCSAIDLETGNILGSSGHEPEGVRSMRTVSSVAGSLFRSPMNAQTERFMAGEGAVSTIAHSLEEVRLASSDHVLLAKTFREGKAVLVLLTRTSANLGLSWAILRSAVHEVEVLLT